MNMGPDMNDSTQPAFNPFQFGKSVIGAVLLGLGALTAIRILLVIQTVALGSGEVPLVERVMKEASTVPIELKGKGGGKLSQILDSDAVADPDTKQYLKMLQGVVGEGGDGDMQINIPPLFKRLTAYGVLTGLGFIAAIIASALIQAGARLMQPDINIALSKLKRAMND